MTSAASVVAERRAPSAVVSGSQRANVMAPRGEPSSVSARTGIPISADAWAAGSLTVAEARTKIGSEPYRAATRRSRRSI